MFSENTLKLTASPARYLLGSSDADHAENNHNSSNAQSPRVVQRTRGIELFPLPSDVLVRILDFCGGEGPPFLAGRRIQNGIKSLILTCRDGENAVRDLSTLSRDRQFALAAYRASALTTYLNHRQLLNHRQPTEMDKEERHPFILKQLLKNSPTLDLRALSSKLVLLLLDQTFSAFPFQTLVVAGEVNLSGEGIPHLTWKKFSNFLVRHADVVNRPFVELRLTNIHYNKKALDLPPLVQALKVYGNGVIDLNLTTGSKVVGPILTQAGKAGVLRSLALWTEPGWSHSFQTFYDSFQACTSLQALQLDVSGGTKHLLLLLKHAEGNQNLRKLEVSIGFNEDVKDIEDLPTILSRFPMLLHFRVDQKLAESDQEKGGKIMALKSLLDSVQKACPQLHIEEHQLTY
jgi:hypothetical protein